MTSEKQLAANRNNAQNSTGPRTEEGKKRSSMNARRHNLTGQVTLMTDEDRAAHDQFSRDLIKHLAPEGPLEIQLAQRVATDSWRLNRASAIEDNLFALGLQEHGGEAYPDNPQIDAALTTARVFTVEAKQLQLLTLYEQRLNRAVQKNLALLRSLQTTRKAEHETALKQAADLLMLRETENRKHLSHNDAQAQARCAEPIQINGFVFSTAEIHAAIDRKQRLSRAVMTNFSDFKPRKFHAQAA